MIVENVKTVKHDIFEVKNMTGGGIMTYSVPEGAEIYIDSSPAIYPSGGIITTPAMIREIPIGMHYITFKLPGYIDETKMAEVMEGQWTDVDAILHQELPKLPLP